MKRQQAEMQPKTVWLQAVSWFTMASYWKLAGRKACLFIEKTGFGKSLCFQFPTTQLNGVTIVFSPLIALMTWPGAEHADKGIRAAAINSNQGEAENAGIITKAKTNQLDILYSTRTHGECCMDNSCKREMKIAMVVIDEAHCISMWGAKLPPQLPKNSQPCSIITQEFSGIGSNCHSH